MAWTTPKTDWETGDLVAAGDMNAIGENLAAMRSRVRAAYTTTADVTIALETGFEDVDGDDLNLTITTSGGDVLVHFDGSITPSDSPGMSFDIEVDGVRLGGNDGILPFKNHYKGAETSVLSFTRLVQNLSGGSHVFKLQCKRANSPVSITLAAGAQFWVREI